LKNALTREPVLRSPDFKKEFIVQTDASNVGIGGILAQLDDEGGEHPVAYYSRRLSDREQKYSTNEKECLAVISALRKWNVYLLGTQFRVETDNRALQWLQKHKSTNPRLERWSLALQPYSFEIVYRKGVLNQNADALSRM
jgi:phospholipid-translocating ATPase